MSERDDLAIAIEAGWGDPNWDGQMLRPIDRKLADAILKSDWLKAHDAKMAATALEEAIDRVLVSDWWGYGWGYGVINEHGNVAPAVREWLLARAAEYRTLAGHGTPEPTTRPKAGDRFMNGDEPGVLVTCPQCDGDGTLHKADSTPEPTITDLPERDATPDEAFELGRIAGYDEADREHHEDDERAVISAWRCPRCGSARWVGWASSPGGPRKAQCVPCGAVSALPTEISA